MEKTAKITKCEFKNEWNNPNGGVLYYHNIELDNGDVGSCGTKVKEPDKLKIGSEITYTLADGKIKLISQQNNTGGGYSGGAKAQYREPFEHKIAGFAMSYSKDLLVSGKIESKDLLPSADKIYTWLLSKKIEN